MREESDDDPFCSLSWKLVWKPGVLNPNSKIQLDQRSCSLLLKPSDV